MDWTRAVVAAAVAIGLTLLATWHFEWSFEKAAFFAPVIVLAVGAALGLIVLWTKVVWESLGRRRAGSTRPRADTQSDTGAPRG